MNIWGYETIPLIRQYYILATILDKSKVVYEITDNKFVWSDYETSAKKFPTYDDAYSYCMPLINRGIEFVIIETDGLNYNILKGE